MRTRLFRQPRSVSIVLVLVLSILGLAVSVGPIAVHASSPALVQSITNSSSLCVNACTLTFPSITAGDFVLVHTFCMLGNSAPSLTGPPTDTATDTYTQVLVNGRTEIWFGIVKANTIPVSFTVNFIGCNGAPGNSGAFSVEDFSGVGGIGNFASQAACPNLDGCTDSISLTVGTNDAIVFEAFDVFGDATTCPTVTVGSSQILDKVFACLGANPFSQGQSLYSPHRGIGVNSFSVTTNKNGAGSGTKHAVVELDPSGGAPSNLGVQTSCFGNCGNPAVTLANTNSTHSVNFNQSISLFYQFQSNLNGQVLNITANVAKTYSNGNTLNLGVYTVAVCTPGQPAFTPVCPGALQKSTTIQNPSKGTNTFTNLAIPVSNGQWVGLAFTATFSGMDLNDTNTAVQIWQAPSGSVALPATISQSTVFAASSKIGLWGFLTGNTITGIPPSPFVGGNCSGFLDCILPNLVFSLCSNQTPTCQNSSALLWALLLTLFVSFFIWKGMSGVLPGVRLPIGEIFILVLLVWIFVLSGLQLLFVWVPLFFFFVVSLMLGKKTGVYL